MYFSSIFHISFFSFLHIFPPLSCIYFSIESLQTQSGNHQAYRRHKDGGGSRTVPLAIEAEIVVDDSICEFNAGSWGTRIKLLVVLFEGVINVGATHARPVARALLVWPLHAQVFTARTYGGT